MEAKKHEMRPFREVWRWCAGYARPSLWKLAVLALIQVSISVCYVGFALCSRTLINAAVAGEGDAAVRQVLLMLAIVLYRIGAGYVFSLWANQIEYKWNITLRTRLYRHLQRAEFADMARYHSGVLSDRLFNDVDALNESVIDVAEGVSSLLSSLVLSFAAMYVLSPLIPVTLFVFCALFVAGGKLVRDMVWRSQNELNDVNADRRSYYQESLRNLLLIRVGGARENAGKRAQGYETRAFGIWMKWFRTKKGIGAGFSLFYQTGYLAAFALCGWGLLQGKLQYGDMAAILQLVSMFQSPFQDMSGLITTYYSALTSASRLMELDDIPPEPETPPVDVWKTYAGMDGIRIRDLRFRYDQEDVLTNAALFLPKGSFTALTGPSGAGKTTLFMLLMGVYTPGAGSLTLVGRTGETPINAGMRCMFSYVPQDHLLVSGSLRENLTFMCGERTDDQILRALEQACALSFVRSLPKGLDTQLREGGQGLSEGQRQRLCIARALLADAPILLLDEVTSALDEPTEQRLIANLRQMKDRTILLITHRMAAAALCDKIYRMENGTLNEVKQA